MLLPKSTLFPYTTLFRSVLTRAIGRIVFDTQVVLPGRTAFVRAVTHFGGTYPITCAPAEMRDRKSTRLNSSHSQISYAVFCLKKKKNLKIIQQLSHLLNF